MMDVSKILAGLNPAQEHAVTTPANVVQILAPRTYEHKICALYDLGLTFIYSWIWKNAYLDIKSGTSTYNWTKSSKRDCCYVYSEGKQGDERQDRENGWWRFGASIGPGYIS